MMDMSLSKSTALFSYWQKSWHQLSSFLPPSSLVVLLLLEEA
jgi:hypothetical protein